MTDREILLLWNSIYDTNLHLIPSNGSNGRRESHISSVFSLILAQHFVHSRRKETKRKHSHIVAWPLLDWIIDDPYLRWQCAMIISDDLTRSRTTSLYCSINDLALRSPIRKYGFGIDRIIHHLTPQTNIKTGNMKYWVLRIRKE